MTDEDKAYWLSRLILKKDDSTGDIIATSPDFTELLTFGATEEDARHHAIDALEEAFAARLAHGEPLPEGEQ